MSESYSLLGLWPIINRWKKLVGTALVLALLTSILVALTLPNIYKSTAVFFPTNPQTTDPDRIATEGSKLELGGRTEDLDRIITIGQSQPVGELLIKRYQLHEHYQVGPPVPMPPTMPPCGSSAPTSILCTTSGTPLS
ncbi:hypothetical protein MUN84_19750 [Hymenobacter sp. 5516J-16]|uniref:hypothetical protein n=1 Tax=Hymenobacter sp. 5516J-16 TaxID=2932253 RepID=UPI001FD34A89|nr:hypothetical protein [Hymenobacter sp. 5516J-16]UOQ76726.1 hypothetical protein MUN84_19750 [Hymenobacter sp. 5516J-16]